MKFAVLLIASCCLIGCGGKAAREAVPATQLGGARVEAVQALCYPPQGWKIEPLKQSARHQHQVWLSPSGQTAYGVIHFSLPWPVGPDMVLRGFLREMKKNEGAADLLYKQSDPKLPGLRFEARGKIYHLRGNLITDGWHGWAIYAGTLVAHQPNPEELTQAEQAREKTSVDDD